MRGPHDWDIPDDDPECGFCGEVWDGEDGDRQGHCPRCPGYTPDPTDCCYCGNPLGDAWHYSNDDFIHDICAVERARRSNI